MTAIAALLVAGGVTGTAHAAAPAAPPVLTGPVVAAAQTPVELYVTGVYLSLFNRAPDPTGLEAWSRALSTGTPPVAVANAITYSAEYRSGLISGSYQTYLGRGPDDDGLQNWLAAMNAGTTIQHMESGFVASDEYFARAGGTTGGWVAQLYVDVLGRAASAAEVDSWSQVIAGGTSRSQVALGFLFSAEHLSTVIEGHYQHLLGRGLDPTGNQAWVSAIQSGTRVEAAIGGIIASAEYTARVAGTATLVTAPPAPTAGTVGVPAGTVLRVHEGDLTITTPGTVIDSMDIRGFVRVKAADVTIKNSIIRGKPGLTGYMSLIQAGDLGPRLTVVDSELVAANPSPYIDGIVGKQFTLRRVNIHGVIDQVKITGDNVLVEDSWLHGNLHYLQDPNYNNTPTHDDNVQIQRGNNITIRNTVMQDAHNAGVQITQDSGVVSNLSFAGNKADGGACTVNVAEKSYGPISGLRFTNNLFGLNTRISRCAVLMPSSTSTLASVTGNTFTDGSVVTISRG